MSRLTLEGIGPLLREKRGDQGIREIAKEIGISPATLSRIERGKVPDLETFSKICRWLKADPGEVLGHSRSETEKTTIASLAPAVHFKADRAISPKAAQSLAEMILAAQRMITSK